VTGEADPQDLTISPISVPTQPCWEEVKPLGLECGPTRHPEDHGLYTMFPDSKSCHQTGWTLSTNGAGSRFLAKS